jgi:hypothetical protein
LTALPTVDGGILRTIREARSSIGTAAKKRALFGAAAEITDVRIDQLLLFQGSRTSLRRSHRLRKRNRPGFRRLRS